MAEGADELYLPNAVLVRIIKDSLPERTIVNREARSAISKAVSSFILYVTSLASTHCSNAKRKTLTADDIFAALKEMQFDHYLPMLTTFLQGCRSKAARKKLESQNSASATKSSTDATQNDFEFLDEIPHSKAGSPKASTSFAVPEPVNKDDEKADDSEEPGIEVDLTEDTDEEVEPDEADEDEEEELLSETVESTSRKSKDDPLESQDP